MRRFLQIAALFLTGCVYAQNSDLTKGITTVRDAVQPNSPPTLRQVQGLIVSNGNVYWTIPQGQATSNALVNLNRLTLPTTNLMYAPVSCGAPQAIAFTMVPTNATWASGTSIFSNGLGATTGWTAQNFSCATPPLFTFTEYFQAGAPKGLQVWWQAQCSTNGTQGPSFLSTGQLAIINPFNWLVLDPFGATTNILPPFYTIPVGPIFLSAQNNGIDLTGIGVNQVVGAVAFHQMAGAPWGIDIEDPLLTLGGQTAYQYITDFGGFNLALVNGNATLNVIGTNGLSIGAAIGYYPGTGWIMQPGGGNNSIFDTTGSLNVFSNLTINGTLTYNGISIAPNLTVGFAGSSTFLNGYSITNDNSQAAGKVVHNGAPSNAYGVGTVLPSGVTTNFTPQGSTSVFYITNGIVQGVQ